MTTKTNSKNTNTLELPIVSETEKSSSIARTMARPSVSAARLQLAFNPNQSLDLMACMKEMQEQFATLKTGDIGRIETMLLGQAHSLQAMFTYYGHKMADAEYLNHLKIYSAIALKAQNQSRQTLQALAEIKNPKRATFIKNQATNQQINMSGHAEIPENISLNPTNELLCEASHATMDNRGTTAASAAHSPVETVENSGR